MVMPCSRSAPSPSSSSAKSRFSPCVPQRREFLIERDKLVVHYRLRIKQKPAQQRGLAVIHRAAGEDPELRRVVDHRLRRFIRGNEFEHSTHQK